MLKIISVFFLILLVGCGVSDNDVETAIKDCSVHGGIKYYYVWPTKEVYCKDGTIIGKYVTSPSREDK